MALKGLKVVEMAGLAPVPFAGLVLADFGASVVRIDKPNQLPIDTLGRGKRSICVSLKEPVGLEVVQSLCHQADILLDPYRPGVMEKLGLGPELLCGNNPRLIYARLTGYGQSGPLALKAGHDINYLAISGVLSMLGGRHENPLPPINLLADFAGGGLMCVTGILLALLERMKSGKGQVIDTSMSKGAAYVSTFLTAGKFLFAGERGTGLLDDGAPFYTTYKTSDGQFMSVGALESKFFKELLKGLEMDESLVAEQMDSTKWPALRQRLADAFASKTRAEWTAIFTKLDACVEPVLSMKEAPEHIHNRDGYSFDPVTKDYFPNPSPTLSRTPGRIENFSQPSIGQDTCDVLRELNYSDENIADLMKRGIVVQSDTRSKL